MIAGVVAYHTSRDDYLKGKVQLTFYQDVKELILVSVLDYMQEGENALISALSLSSVSHVSFIALNALTDSRFDNFLQICNCILQNITEDLITEVLRLCNDNIGHDPLIISADEYQRAYQKSLVAIFGVRKVILYDDSVEKLSWCTTAVPTAFLMRCRKDKNDFLKIWPSDVEMRIIIQTLSHGYYHSFNEFSSAISIIALRKNIPSDQLSVMVQCLLVEHLLKLQHKGKQFNQQFSELLDELFQSFCQGVIVC